MGTPWPGAGAGEGLTFLAAALEALRLPCADGRVVVIETTVLDAERGEPATSHVRNALAAGAHVVTANKGPAAFAYHELAALADRAGRAWRFESAVMDGVPVFSLVADAMPAIRVSAFRGVVNTTCGYILAAIERGVPFADALAEMQRPGIAEADPSLDVDGWDAAAKAAALANVLLDARITPHDVDRAGIRDLDPAALAPTARRRVGACGWSRTADATAIASRSAPLPPGSPRAIRWRRSPDSRTRST